MAHQVYQLPSVVEMTVVLYGQSFPINVIASHADLCAGKHQNEMLR